MTTNYRWIQTRLTELGLDPGPIDGVRGPRTDAAVVAFKKSIGFLARPYIGPLTLAALLPNTDKKYSDIPWMTEAQRVRGLHEQRDMSRLKGWFDRSVSWIDPREVPWCGAFVATCFRLYKPDILLPTNPLGARNWLHFGKPCTPVFGSCLVFWRGSKAGWKGHVGFYYGEDDTAFHVLGGNQSNAVTVTRVDKNRLLGARWPIEQDITGQRILLTPSGTTLSTNEA